MITSEHENFAGVFSFKLEDIIDGLGTKRTFIY